MTTTTNDMLVGITGPFTSKASGKFKADGETPVMVKCAPYWVVRYLSGDNCTILKDRRFGSEKQAKEFAATLREHDGR